MNNTLFLIIFSQKIKTVNGSVSKILPKCRKERKNSTDKSLKKCIEKRLTDVIRYAEKLEYYCKLHDSQIDIATEEMKGCYSDLFRSTIPKEFSKKCM